MASSDGAWSLFGANAAHWSYQRSDPTSRRGGRGHRLPQEPDPRPPTPSASPSAFTDSIFAEDIGKFPDTNLAESLNRIPGVQLTREITGEGLNIAIRGLGTNFTKILLNGNQIAVASSGAHRLAEPEPRGRPRPVPDRAVHPPGRQQDADGQSCRRRRRRHRQHAQRPSVRPGRPHLTYSVQGNYNGTPRSGARAAR
jgi:hypothetical protein